MTADQMSVGETTSAQRPADLTAALMLEYDRLKAEQAQRIGFRDNFIYATLAAAAAVVTGAHSFAAPARTLLLLPPVCVILGWTYLVNDQKVTAIGQYLRCELGPRLSALAGAPVFGWEAPVGRVGDPRHRQRKWIQLGVDLATFCLSALAAIAVYLVSGPPRPELIVAALAELAATAALAWQITVYAAVGSNTE